MLSPTVKEKQIKKEKQKMFWVTTAVFAYNKIKLSHEGTKNTTFKVFPIL